MTTPLPEALRLCEIVDYLREPTEFQRDAAAELRRLHEVNQELLAALDFYGRYILRSKSGDASILTPIDHDCGDQARAAIAKGETT